jgi:hypothetical protein
VSPVKEEEKICPFCSQPIPQEKIKEIESKFKAEIDRKASEYLAEKESEYQKRIKELEKESKEKEKKLKAEWEEEKKQIKESYTEFEKELKERYQERENELKELKEQYEKFKKELEEQIKEKERLIKEKYGEEIRNVQEEEKKKREELERERLKLVDQINDLKRQLEAKTPEELGREAQEDLLSILRKEFPDDVITETKKGKEGADIFQEVRYRGDNCGLIIYEVKNVKNWSNNFIDQVNNEKSIHKTPHVILVTNVFPSKDRDICEKEGVIIIHPSKCLYIARLLRKSIIDMHQLKLSQREINAKVDRLYRYLTSEDFRQEIKSLFNSIEKLKKLQDSEQRTHHKTWAKQSKEFESLIQHSSKIDGEISSIVEEKIPVPLIALLPTSRSKANIGKS